MTATATEAPARCTVLAVLTSPCCPDAAAARRLAEDVRAAGADGVTLTTRSVARRAAGRAPAAIDGIARFVEQAGELPAWVSPYDLVAVTGLAPLPVHGWKIDPSLLTHLSLLDEIAGDGRPVLAGVAGCTSRELDDAVGRLPPGAILLHTLITESGAAQVTDVAHMIALRRYARPVGYADSRPDTVPALIAVALGATLVEKPLAVSDGDPAAGLATQDFRAFVSAVRQLEQVLAGDGARTPLPEECDAIDEDRVSIVAARPIPRGTAIRRSMLTFRAPGTGLPPRLLPLVEGHEALYDIPEGAPVTFGLIQL